MHPVRHLLDQSNQNLETLSLQRMLAYPFILLVRSTWRKSSTDSSAPTKLVIRYPRVGCTRPHGNASRACHDFASGFLHHVGKGARTRVKRHPMWPMVNMSARLIPFPLCVYREYTCPVSYSNRRTRNRTFKRFFTVRKTVVARAVARAEANMTRYMTSFVPRNRWHIQMYKLYLNILSSLFFTYRLIDFPSIFPTNLSLCSFFRSLYKKIFSQHFSPSADLTTDLYKSVLSFLSLLRFSRSHLLKGKRH